MTATSEQPLASKLPSDSDPTHRVTVIPGDGVGPEIVGAAQRVLAELGAKIDWQTCEAGAATFARGLRSGVPPETIDSVCETGVVLKGPLTTPVGYGEKSANVTLRKLFETYANVRPARELPGVETPFAGRGVDLVVVRENVEDLYAGIEHMQSPTVAQALKLITRQGCERICRFAFEYAAAEGRSSVHCATKANILKLTEGMLKRTFESVAREYPQIEPHHIIVDNCCHQLAIRPEQFEVIVTTNMNGDIVSDLTSGLVGGLGVAPSANIGERVAIFEAVHGSAPDIAGKGIVNPTAILLSTTMLLRHLGDFTRAATLERAILATLADGSVLTGDLAQPGLGASTDEFVDAVVEYLGASDQAPELRKHTPMHRVGMLRDAQPTRTVSRSVVGIDVFIETTLRPAQLGQHLEGIANNSPLLLTTISSRGGVVYPALDTQLEPDTADVMCARFVLHDSGATLADEAILALLARMSPTHRWVHVEKLQRFDDADAFSQDQGAN